jgi:hypothetical protein
LVNLSRYIFRIFFGNKKRGPLFLTWPPDLYVNEI